MYLHGFYTVYSHKVANYRAFLVLLITSILAGIIITYVKASVYAPLFILKALMYLYTDWKVLPELYTVLIIPSDLHAMVLNNSAMMDDQSRLSDGASSLAHHASDEVDHLLPQSHQKAAPSHRNLMLELMSDDDVESTGKGKLMGRRQSSGSENGVATKDPRS